jgi:hypothetical protein
MPSTATTTGTVTFTNPLKFETVEGVLGSLLSALQGIIVVLALVAIVVGALLYITSGGDEGRMTLAKGAITAAMIGLALGLAAPSFLKEIGNVLGWGPVNSSMVGSAPTLTQLALNVLNFLLSIIGVLGIIMMVVGGVIYITSAGNEEQIATGKKIVTFASLGIFIALGSMIIVAQIARLFVP